jgi:hypothetical protein
MAHSTNPIINHNRSSKKFMQSEYQKMLNNSPIAKKRYLEIRKHYSTTGDAINVTIKKGKNDTIH